MEVPWTKSMERVFKGETSGEPEKQKAFMLRQKRE
jgi:hypothetical protein